MDIAKLGKKLSVFVLIIFFSCKIYSQNDTAYKVFGSVNEAADTVYARLNARKFVSISDYLMPWNIFLQIVRTTDTTTPEILVDAQYKASFFKSEKSFYKTYKKVKKLKPNLKRYTKKEIEIIDAGIFSGNYMQKITLPLTYKKKTIYIRFYAIEVRGKWRIINKFSLEK